MPDLVFEIWKDDANSSSQMSMVHPQTDRSRRIVSPSAVLVHSFTASSDFQAFRHNNAWRGFEPWTPPEGDEEHFFTEEEAAKQRAYLRDREIG